VAPIDWSNALYVNAQNTFGRPITITPVISQPNAPAYSGRGIFDTSPMDVLAEEGAIFSEQRSVLDIRDAEFPVMPLQGDQVTIPPYGILPGGNYEIIDLKANGGGETSLALRQIVGTKPSAS
jgi:hypothetical protein